MDSQRLLVLLIRWLDLVCSTSHGPKGAALSHPHTHRRVHSAVQVRWSARQREQNNRNDVRSERVAGDELLC